MSLKISDLVKRCIVSSYLFSDSNEKLEKEQYIECKIKEFRGKKPYFILFVNLFYFYTHQFLYSHYHPYRYDKRGGQSGNPQVHPYNLQDNGQQDGT